MTDEEIENMIRNNPCTQYGHFTEEDIQMIKDILKNKHK